MKPCDGIKLTPIKVTLNPVANVPTMTPKGYTPPSKRKEQQAVAKVLTKEELASDAVFPSLAPMKPMTSGASWAQLRTRLSQNPFDALSQEEGVSTTNTTFMGVVQQRLLREEKEKEDGIRREAITNPTEMSMEQREAAGWTTLRLPPNYVEINERALSRRVLREEEYYDSGHAFVDNPRFECVMLGGDEIERGPINDYFATKALKPVNYRFTSDESLAAARARFLPFMKKSTV